MHLTIACFVLLFVCFSGRLRLRVPLAEPRGGLGVPRGSRRPAGGGGGRAGRPPATDVTSARRQRDRAACRRDADTSLAFVFSPLPSSTSADLQPADSLCVCVRLVPPGSRCCASLSLKTAHCCTLLTGPTDLLLAPSPTPCVTFSCLTSNMWVIYSKIQSEKEKASHNKDRQKSLQQ